MVAVPSSRTFERMFIAMAVVLLAATPALAQQGQVLTTLESSVITAAKGWETTIMNQPARCYGSSPPYG